MSLGEIATLYWPFYTSIGGLLFAIIVGWVNLKRDIEDLNKEMEATQKRMDYLESALNNINPVLLQIQKDIVEIKTILKIKFGDK